MNIRILSDLHLEFAEFDPPIAPADVVLLAGDIGMNDRGIRWAKAKFPTVPVVYVAGNHEYYGENVHKVDSRLTTASHGSNVRFLQNDRTTINGVHFLGCTLWSDFDLFGNAAIDRLNANNGMNDYRKIRCGPQYRKLTTRDTIDLHRRSIDWLLSQFSELKGDPIVVVTHHAPSSRSVPDRYKTNTLSAAYASNLDRIVEQSNALLWVHGHCHEAADYTIGSTRVLSNPRGYPGEATGFDAGLVVRSPS